MIRKEVEKIRGGSFAELKDKFDNFTFTEQELHKVVMPIVVSEEAIISTFVKKCCQNIKEE